MQHKISVALFCHVCLSISVDEVQDIGAEIFHIKRKSLGENLSSEAIEWGSENGGIRFRLLRVFLSQVELVSFFWIQTGSRSTEKEYQNS
jgi:hypothetical protein